MRWISSKSSCGFRRDRSKPGFMAGPGCPPPPSRPGEGGRSGGRTEGAPAAGPAPPPVTIARLHAAAAADQDEPPGVPAPRRRAEPGHTHQERSAPAAPRSGCSSNMASARRSARPPVPGPRATAQPPSRRPRALPAGPARSRLARPSGRAGRARLTPGNKVGLAACDPRPVQVVVATHKTEVPNFLGAGTCELKPRTPTLSPRFRRGSHQKGEEDPRGQ